MTAHTWVQIVLVLLIVFMLSIPVGRYLADIVMDRKMRLDAVFDPLDEMIIV
jgi:K+-transporting ATPase A subunit